MKEISRRTVRQATSVLDDEETGPPLFLTAISPSIKRWYSPKLENRVDKTGGYCKGSDRSTKEEFVSSRESTFERTMEFFERSETRH